MILGLGIDVIEVDRIRRAIERFGTRFTGRIFLAGELGGARSGMVRVETMAGRFAAKEAVSKALGTGLGGGIGWRDIEIRNAESGQPRVVLHNKALAIARARGIGEIHLSISHVRGVAVAVAVAESAPDHYGETSVAR